MADRIINSLTLSELLAHPDGTVRRSAMSCFRQLMRLCSLCHDRPRITGGNVCADCSASLPL